MDSVITFLKENYDMIGLVVGVVGVIVAVFSLIDELKKRVAASAEPVVILTVGAGDIDRLVPDITKALDE